MGLERQKQDQFTGLTMTLCPTPNYYSGMFQDSWEWLFYFYGSVLGSSFGRLMPIQTARLPSLVWKCEKDKQVSVKNSQNPGWFFSACEHDYRNLRITMNISRSYYMEFFSLGSTRNLQSSTFLFNSQDFHKILDKKRQPCESWHWKVRNTLQSRMGGMSTMEEQLLNSSPFSPASACS